MSTRTTTKQEPAPPSSFAKYILQAVTEGHSTIVVADERPTMEWVKDACGEGTHTLFNGEGKVLRRFTVVTNRNGNLKITGTTPEGLEGVSTLNLHRLVKQYVRIVKVWPAKLSDTRALSRELTRREALLEEALTAAETQLVSASDADSSLEEAAAAALALAVEESKAARATKVSA
jgi:hypothetical protein